MRLALYSSVTCVVCTRQEHDEDDDGPDEVAGLVVGDVDHRTRLLRPLSSGSFGEVYVGELEASERRVAVKLERQGSGVTEQLLYEGNVYRRLEDGPGIARLHWFGMHPAGLNVSSRRLRQQLVVLYTLPLTYLMNL